VTFNSYLQISVKHLMSLKTVRTVNQTLLPSVFLRILKGCRGGALGCQHHFPFYIRYVLTDFHKNASFRPNMLNYLNKTFTFGKQTKDNFINTVESCNVGLHPQSFTHFRAHFPFGVSRGGSSPRRTRNTSRSTAISHSSAGSTSRPDQARSKM